MTRVLYTGDGRPIEIGREVARGGEGTVHELESDPGSLAKLYHAGSLPGQRKQSKLRFMAGSADPQLLQFVAWPRQTLHAVRGGSVVGFVMERATGLPVHVVYSPKQFRQEFPNRGWSFLLFVARNIAAAFDTVHQRGHVIGDVNHGNVLVKSDSRVVLIDADSYQVASGPDVHLCEVGVAHFTPPELQGTSSFSSEPRTANHDNFGLALLIFHLLMGGRHPFAGVPSIPEAGLALESDIRSFRYAYGPDGPARGLVPPPSAIPIACLPGHIRDAFDQAFTQRGSVGNRLTARDWTMALDSLRNDLRKCRSTDVHQFPAHLEDCPWCALEQRGVVYFISIAPGLAANSSGAFVLARAIAAIESVPAPAVEQVSPQAMRALRPVPLPDSCDFRMAIGVSRAIAVICCVVAAALVPPGILTIGVGILALVAWFAIGEFGAAPRREERKRRESSRSAARASFDHAYAQYRLSTGAAAFAAKRQELLRMRDEFQTIARQEEEEIAKLSSTLEDRQRQQYLDRYSIESAVIPGIGPSRKAALRSFGIETAADVSWARVIALRGFGEAKTSALVDWRKAIERRFSFNPRLGVPESDRLAVRSRFAARRRLLETALSGGAAELQGIRREGELRSAPLVPLVRLAAERVAQAEADLAVL